MLRGGTRASLMNQKQIWVINTVVRQVPGPQEDGAASALRAGM